MLLKKKFLRICRDYDLFLKNKNFFYKKFFFSFLQVKSSKSINPNFDSGKKFKKLRILTYLKEIIQNIFSFSSNKITISKSSNILVLSTCINKEHLKNIDFYLGHIIKEIKKKNKITLVIRNLTNDNITIKDFKKNLKNLEIHEIRNKLNIFLEIYFFINCFFNLFKIFYSLKKKNYFSKFIKPKTIINFCGNLREVFQFEKILKLNSYKIFLTTYEGNAWERLFFFKAKKVIPKITNVGYHFSYHLENEHSIFRNLKKNFDPDIILTSGEHSKKLFKSKKFICNQIINVGSNKYVKLKKSVHKKFKFNVLLLPEGYLSESVLLYNFVSNFLDYYKKFQFTIRLHPSLKNLSGELFKDKRIKISNKSLMQDFRSNKFSLYRGSSSIISAVNCGVVPIYYSFKNELSLDPFYGLNTNIVYNNEIKKFNKILMDNLNKNTNSNIYNFSSKYYSDFKKNKIKLKLLEKIYD